MNIITLVSAFCFGSMGIFGAINEGITGSTDILLTKAVLDLFSGIVFGTLFGLSVSLNSPSSPCSMLPPPSSPRT